MCGGAELIQQTAETLSFEGAPATLLDRLNDFLQQEQTRCALLSDDLAMSVSSVSAMPQHQS